MKNMSAERIRPKPKTEKALFIDDIIWQVVRSPLILEAFARVDRKDYIPPKHAYKAYRNEIIQLGGGSSISQPSLVAAMIDHLGLRGKEKVFELGTGSGYCAAVLSYCCNEVHSVDNHAILVQEAAGRFKALGINNVTLHVGDGLQGLPELSPFDSIIITAGIRIPPQKLLEQLREGGRIIMPLGPDPQNLEMVVALKRDDDLIGKVVDHVKFHSIKTDGPEGWTEEHLKKVLEIKRRFIKGWGERKGLKEREAYVSYASMQNWGLSVEDLEDPTMEEAFFTVIRIPVEAYPIFDLEMQKERELLNPSNELPYYLLKD